MRAVASETTGRAWKGFALGNLLPAVLLAIGVVALPVRFWPADVIVGTASAVTAGASIAALLRPALAWQALRVAALVLLGVGLLVIAAGALSLAFLSGVHGDYGRGGALLMTLVLFLVVPYTLVYPIIELLWLHARRETPAPARSA